MQDLTLSDIQRNDGMLVSIENVTVEGGDDLSSQEARLITRFDEGAHTSITDFELSQTPETQNPGEDRQWHEQSQFQLAADSLELIDSDHEENSFEVVTEVSRLFPPSKVFINSNMVKNDADSSLDDFENTDPED